MKTKESKKTGKYLDLDRELNQLCNCDINCSWGTWKGRQRLGKGTKRIGNRKKGRKHPNYTIVKNGQNTEKSPGGVGRLTVTQTPLNELKMV